MQEANNNLNSFHLSSPSLDEVYQYLQVGISKINSLLTREIH